jgi:hypothetical protein
LPKRAKNFFRQDDAARHDLILDTTSTLERSPTHFLPNGLKEKITQARPLSKRDCGQGGNHGGGFAPYHLAKIYLTYLDNQNILNILNFINHKHDGGNSGNAQERKTAIVLFGGRHGVLPGGGDGQRR